MRTRALLGAALTATAIASLALTHPTGAQPPRGEGGNDSGRIGRGGPRDGRGGRGGRGGPGFGMRRSAKGRLERLVMSVGALGRNGTAPLSPTQAQRMNALIKPWRHQPHMDEASAGRLLTRLDAVLTSAQRSALAARRGRGGPGGPDGPGGMRGPGRMRPPRDGGPDGGMGGPRGGGRDGRRGGGGFGGPNGGPPTDAQRQQMRARMDALRGFFALYNPLYVGTYAQIQQMPAPMREGFTRRRQRANAVLTQLARRAA